MKNIGEKSFKNIGARNIQRNKKSVGWVGTGAGFHTDVAAVVHNTVNTANTEKCILKYRICGLGVEQSFRGRKRTQLPFPCCKKAPL